MEVLTFLFSASVIPFTACIGVSLLLALFVLIGFDDLEMDGADADFDVEVDGADSIPVFSWLGFGKVPLFFLLTVLFSVTGFLGLLFQSVVAGIVGTVLPWWAAGLVIIMPSLLLTRMFGRMFAKALPQVEDYSQSLAGLVNKTAEVTIPAAPGSFGEAKVLDNQSEFQYVRVKMTTPVARGDDILLSAYDDTTRAFEGGKSDD